MGQDRGPVGDGRGSLGSLFQCSQTWLLLTMPVTELGLSNPAPPGTLGRACEAPPSAPLSLCPEGRKPARLGCHCSWQDEMSLELWGHAAGVGRQARG